MNASMNPGSHACPNSGLNPAALHELDEALLPARAALLSGQAELRADSRQVQKGDVFAALPPAVPGGADHGGEHIRAALERGAAFILASPETLAGKAPGKPADKEPFPSCPGAAWIAVPDVREAMGRLASARFGTDSLPFPLIGVTGTNGKTTSAYLLEHVYRAARKRVGVMGTVSYRWPGHEQEAPLTTPDCLTLHRSLAAMREAGGSPELPGRGVDAAIMEVSSHALDQKRVAGLRFQAALFTNLTQDHLDYHQSMERYFEAKRRLFLDPAPIPLAAAINADDPYGGRLLAELPQARGFSLDAPAGRNGVFLSCRVLADSPEGLRLHVSTADEAWDMRSPLVGRHNASNLAGVMTLALSLGFRAADFACFHTFYGVPGRLERVPAPEHCAWSKSRAGAGVFVDYAHTPDALIRAQEALRDAGFTRLVTVFGCGGDRDKSKRPLMGQAVARLSDVAVVTSDNPRTENPDAILDDIMPGLAEAAETHRRSDRREALALALELTRPGDALLVAGKGHEPYQIIGNTRHPFSDQQILKELMQCE